MHEKLPPIFYSTFDTFYALKMSEKTRATSSSHKSFTKKQRKAIDIEAKLKIVKQHEEGSNVQTIASSTYLENLAISTILNDKEKVKELAKTTTKDNAAITRQQKGLINEMEKLLAI